jgi:hypothetical protein
MLAVALALSLVPAQSPDFYLDDVPRGPSRVAEVRAGGGGMAMRNVEGVGATGEAGMEFVPWGPVALRLTVGGSVRLGWGAFYFSPEAVFRATPLHSTFSPYLAAGVQAGFVNITERARRRGLGSTSAPLFGEPDDTVAAGGLGPSGPVPLRFTAGPQLTGGVRLQAFRAYALDVGLRYTMVRWRGDTLHAVGAVLTICAPN